MKSIILFLLLFASVMLSADAGLPRVLILGDSVYQPLAQSVAKELRGRVEIVYATAKPGEAFQTGISRGRLDELLGDGKWDLIHFNFGLGDLLYKAPGITRIRALPKNAGGVRVTTPAQYEKNLQAIVTRLKASGAKLVWASTTPISGSSTDIFDVDSEIEYNAIAAKVMTKERVPTNDMHAYIMDLRATQKTKSRSGDPFSFDKNAPIDPPVVKAILSQLRL